MDCSRERGGRRYLVTVVLTAGFAFGGVRQGAAQPVGALTQLSAPDGCTQLGGDSLKCRDGIGLDTPTDAAMSPDGKSLYVASFGSNAVTVFARDTDTGALTQLDAPDGCHADMGDGTTCHDAIGLFGATAVAVSPDNAHVYVGSVTSASITVFSRDKSSGTLTQLPAPDGCIAKFGGGGDCTDAYGPLDPTNLLISPNGKFVYALALNGDAIGVFARDKGTGTLTQLPAPEGCIAATGDGITCKSAIALDGPHDMAFSKNGQQLYVASHDADAVLVFDRDDTTGALTQLAAPFGCVAENGDGVTCVAGVGLDGPRSVVAAKQGQDIYVASSESDSIAILERDSSTGALSQLPLPDGCLAASGDGITCVDLDGVLNPHALVLTKNGQFLYAASGSGLGVFQRDKKTGYLEQLAAPYGCTTVGGDGTTCLNGVGVNGARGIVLANNGKHAYVAAALSDAVAAFSVEK